MSLYYANEESDKVINPSTKIYNTESKIHVSLEIPVQVLEQCSLNLTLPTI